MKKTLITLTLAAAGFVALAAPASAHTPRVSHDCSSAGATLTVHLTQYEPGSTVTVNGQVQASGTKVEFGTAEYKSTFNLGDGTQPVKWTVRVTNGTEYTPKTDKYDQEFSDTVEACVTPVPTTTAPLESKDLTPSAPPTTEPVDYCEQLRVYFTANPDAPRTNGWDTKCAPVLVDAPVVISTQVLDRAPVEAPVALAFTGSETTERAVMAAALFTIGVSCLLIGRRFGKVA